MEDNSHVVPRGRHRCRALSRIAFAVILAIMPGPTNGQDITLQQVNVRNDRNEPVRSTIFHFPPTKVVEPLPLRDTDDQGKLKLNFICPLGTRIQAQPHSEAYTYSKAVFCRQTLELRVEPISVVVQLQKNLDKALEWEDYATVVLIANELANIESRESKGIAGGGAETLAVVYSEKAFGVDDGIDFDRMQGKAVMAPKLQAKVREFQNRNGLKETGQLNYETISTLAGTSSSIVRYTAYGANRM